jgi:hypothetical protein
MFPPGFFYCSAIARALPYPGPAVVTVGALPTDSYAGQQHPDPWLAFHVNQAWGRFGAAVVAHKNSATYYSSTFAGGCPAVTNPTPTGAAHGTAERRHSHL